MASPLAAQVRQLREQRGLRQQDLAKALLCNQSRISTLENGTAGPPDIDFLERFSEALRLTDAERQDLWRVAQASDRRLVIDTDAPTHLYWLLDDLRRLSANLDAETVGVVRAVLRLRPPNPMASLDRPCRRPAQIESTMQQAGA